MLAALRKLLGGKPPDPQAELDAAIALHEAGRLEQAEAAYRSLVGRAPRSHAAIHLLGLISHQRGDHVIALRDIDHAIAIRKTVALYHFNRGNVLVALGSSDEACSAFGAALALKPDYPSASYNQAKTQAELRRYAEAIRGFRALPPDMPGLVHDYANALLGAAAEHNADETALLDEAITLLMDSWPAAPAPFEARAALGWALEQRKRWSEAVEHYTGALMLTPDSAKVHNNLANCYNQLGRISEAVMHYRRLYEIAPDFPDALTSVLANLNYDPVATPQQVFDEHRAWAQAVAAPLYRQSPRFDNSPDLARPLRVGFISPDLRRHPVSYIFGPILGAFDGSAVEAVCYYNFPQKDVVTERLLPLAHSWRDVAVLSDEQLHDLIRSDRIDILVDLAGHTIHNRLRLFAGRAAPIQVSWLGYFNTTGLETMDYFLSDPHSSPSGQERFYSENLLRLPNTRFCYQPSEYMPKVSALPATRNGHVTFGCFNNLSKVNELVLGVWARVLAAVPQSRLIMQAAAFGDGPNCARFLKLAANAGMDTKRLELRGFMPVEKAPYAYHDIDIALDPFPFCGGMTSLESLWMGVPVVTLEQPMIAGRQTLSLLANLGLPDLVAANDQNYVEIAVALARDPVLLAGLRRDLRLRFAASPLQDYAGFAREMETAFRRMWHDWLMTRTQT